MNFITITILLCVIALSQTLPNRNGFGQQQSQPRISAQKCEIYKDLVSESIRQFTGQLWQYKDQTYWRTTKIYNCNSFTGLIVGGDPAKPGEFPHMAAIGWKNTDGSVYFKCGGSLISSRYVLTVAHCYSDNIRSPSFVRLGDQNLATSNDGAEPVEYNIKRFIKHENYQRDLKENDIALIELTDDVTFTKFIRPACLQQDNQFENPLVATGWGQIGTYNTETSNVLLKVSLNKVSMAACNDTHEGDLFKTQICAGGKPGKDTCRGDSGGPIQVSHDKIACVYNIVGLTSYGSFKCGSRSPSIYTKISAYLDWIEQRVWP